MNLTSTELRVLVANSVVEVKFRRRKQKPGYSIDRRMLCTNNWALLTSMPGRIALNFKPPTHPPPYNAKAKGLVTTWDLFWQQYRNISLDNYVVISAMPVQTEEDRTKFWAFFNAVLQDMSGQQKIGYMNS